VGSFSLPTGISSAAGNLTDFISSVTASAAKIAAAGNGGLGNNDLWPIKNYSIPNRPLVAGLTDIEKGYHYAMEQGRFLEKDLGGAISYIQAKKQDLNEKIAHYLSLNTLALDGQLSDHPRAAKYVADSIKFVQQIRKYTTEISNLLDATQANIAVLLATEKQMQAMIQTNLNCLANLLQEICNWNLPSLPSLAALLGHLWHWNGFNFNIFSGFNLSFNLNFSQFANFNFSQCIPRLQGSSQPSRGTSISDGSGLTYTYAGQPVPLGGQLGVAASLTDPAYIAMMQATTTPVFNPTLSTIPVSTTSNGVTTAAILTSLPDPAAIISNYSLTPTQYEQNVVSLIPALQPVVIQPTDADYNISNPSASVPSLARQNTLRSLLSYYINLQAIVNSGFDPNITAAWLFYLGLNRTGRGGTWISNLNADFSKYIAPSLTYLGNNPVPFNTVLGGTGITLEAPTAIPLIALLQEDTGVLKWRLSFQEAALLGYPRNRNWDAYADATDINITTGTDPDYVPTVIAATPTTTLTLGQGTATYPVVCTFPQTIASNLTQVIAIAAAAIANTPSYQSVHPQYRYIYDTFAQATLVDRYSQFWREFNANLVAFLAMDPYIVSFAVSYVGILNAAVNPLADATPFTLLSTDANSRNRSWTVGSDLINIPAATDSSVAYEPPTAQNNGWATGALDAATYLSRPDIQAQPLPVQMAMLYTNQTYASLMTLSANLSMAVSDTIANADLSLAAVSLPGWEAETTVDIDVAPGVGQTISFGTIDFDQTNYIQDAQTYVIQETNPYILNVSFNWDTGGADGTRTATIFQNGVSIATASTDFTSDTPYTTQISTLSSFNEGDIITVQASHSLTTPQTLLTGSNLLGLLDVTASTNVITTGTPVSGGGTTTTTSSSNGTLPFTTGAVFNAFCALSIQSDGNVYPVSPKTNRDGSPPFIDGIATQASTAIGSTIQVNVAYGAVVATKGAGWTVGGLIYVIDGGNLTQNYALISSQYEWIIVVGRAYTADSFIYEPHLPMNYTRNLFTAGLTNELAWIFGQSLTPPASTTFITRLPVNDVMSAQATGKWAISGHTSPTYAVPTITSASNLGATLSGTLSAPLSSTQTLHIYSITTTAVLNSSTPVFATATSFSFAGLASGSKIAVVYDSALSAVVSTSEAAVNFDPTVRISSYLTANTRTHQYDSPALANGTYNTGLMLDYLGNPSSMGLLGTYADGSWSTSLVNVSTAATLASTNVLDGLLVTQAISSTDPNYALSGTTTKLYDQAVCIIASLASTDTTLADRLVAGLLNAQTPSGQWYVSVNAYGTAADPYYRTGTQAWCIYALSLYLHLRPTSQYSAQVETAIISGISAMTTNYYVSNNTQAQYGLFTIGNGEYDNGLFNPVTQTGALTEDNIIAWFALNAANVILPDHGYDVTAATVATAVTTTLFVSTRFNRGVSSTGLADTANNLRINAWGSLFLLAVGQPVLAAAALTACTTFLNYTNGCTGYAPYVGTGGYPGALPNVSSDGTFAVAISTDRQVGIDAANVIVSGIVALRGTDGGWQGHTAADKTYGLTTYECGAGTGWSVIFNTPTLRNLIFTSL